MTHAEVIHPGYVRSKKSRRAGAARELHSLVVQVRRLEQAQRRPRIIAGILLALGVASHVVMFGYLAHQAEQSRGRELALRARLAGLEVLTLQDATPVAYNGAPEGRALSVKALKHP